MDIAFAKDIAARAAWTFIQAFAGAFVGISTLTDTNVIKACALSGLTAGALAVVKTIVSYPRTPTPVE